MIEGEEKLRNKYLLGVLNEIKNDPYFYKQKHLVRYTAPTGDKVTAVWDASDLGAFNINREENQGTEFVFYLEILEPFEKVLERVVKEGQGKKFHSNNNLVLRFNGKSFTINSKKFSPQGYILIKILYSAKKFVKASELRAEIRKKLLKRNKNSNPKVAIGNLVSRTNKTLETHEFPLKVIGKRTHGYKLDF